MKPISRDSSWSRTLVGLIMLSLLPAVATAAEEIPELQARVESGELPAVEERLPDVPFAVPFDDDYQTLGEYGGELRLLMGKVRDIRMMVVYGYARLVGFDDDLVLGPDVLESFDVEDNRIFTMHLRPGHKWSDGVPFTAEDFRFYWEDVVNNEELSPFGPPRSLMVDGEPPKVEILDETTVRYAWSQPNPYFLPALAAPSPLFIFRPAHYLKQFHPNYVSEEEIKALVKESGSRNWAGLQLKKDNQYKFDNPDLPTLQPWVNTTAPPADRFVFVRNPFYHRVDPEGRQLPYIDRVVINVVSSDLVPAKTGAGDADLQGRYLRLDNYSFLKAGEKHSDYKVYRWDRVHGSQVAIYPNFNSTDPVWRELVRNTQFRRALSLAVDRNEVNQIIYYGLVRESNNTVLPKSPLYREKYQTQWAKYDPDEANRLLDELGLDKRDDRGVRLRPDGKPLEVVVHTSGESTEETDVLELVHDAWLKVGVKLYTKPSQREVFRNRVYSGQAMMAVWSGILNGVASAGMSPHEFAPTAQDQLQWPKWGQYYETGGNAGEPPDIESAIHLAELNEQWRTSTDEAAREQIWHEMLSIHAEEVYSIGIVNGAFQPITVNDHLKNVPAVGIYSWDPGSYFGIYRPDTFWFDQTRR